MIIRQARAADIPALVALRMELFCEVGELVTQQADPALWQATLDYFTRAMSEESALSWLAEADTQEGGKQIVAAGTLALFERPPYPGNLAGGGGVSAQYVYAATMAPAGDRHGAARCHYSLRQIASAGQGVAPCQRAGAPSL